MADSTLAVLAVLFAAAALFLGLRLLAVSRLAASLASQLEALSDLSGNGLIRLSGDRALAKAAERLNETLRRLRAERIRLERGDQALRRALAGWSHDLRTPLTAASGYISLLRREPQTEKAAGYLATVAKRLSALQDTLEDLFAFSFSLAETDTVSLESRDLRAELEESAALFYDSFEERGILPDLLMPDAPVRVLANARALKRILYNLWSNAAKYAKSVLRIELGADGTVVFANDAIGFDPVRLAALFGQNESVPYAGERTGGMGLLAAKMLCEKMGGLMTGEYAGGTVRITFRLPGAKEDLSAGSPR